MCIRDSLDVCSTVVVNILLCILFCIVMLLRVMTVVTITIVRARVCVRLVAWEYTVHAIKVACSRQVIRPAYVEYCISYANY